MVKICPQCKSTDVEPIIGGTFGMLECKKCGYRGAIFPDIKEEEESEEKK